MTAAPALLVRPLTGRDTRLCPFPLLECSLHPKPAAPFCASVVAAEFGLTRSAIVVGCRLLVLITVTLFHGGLPLLFRIVSPALDCLFSIDNFASLPELKGSSATTLTGQLPSTLRCGGFGTCGDNSAKPGTNDFFLLFFFAPTFSLLAGLPTLLIASTISGTLPSTSPADVEQ